MARIFLGFMLIVCMVLLLASLEQESASAQTDQRCFSETNLCIEGRIREYWEQNDGLSVFGYPITPQRTEVVEGSTRIVQWFQRNRLEVHEENLPPYDILLGRIGVNTLQKRGINWQTSYPAEDPQPGCRYFEQTKKNVCADILNTWRSTGLNLGDPGISEAESLALFGLPITGEFQEQLSDGNTYTVQYFERARFERHPNNAPPFNILLGLLGNESLRV